MDEILSKRDERVKHFDLGNGQKQYVGFGAPVHYKNARGVWDDIVLDFQPDGLGNLVTDQNKVSCGFRQDKKLVKYFGLRYDYDHQFEATPTSIVLDGVEQLGGLEFDLAATAKTTQSVSNKINSNVEIVNRLSEVALRNYFKVTNPIGDFAITEQLHLKGLTCNNKKPGKFILLISREISILSMKKGNGNLEYTHHSLMTLMGNTTRQSNMN
jgi:hypothetical protein